MCLIIRCEKDKPLSRELLEDMQRRNDDGFGFMWIQDNKLKTHKNNSDDFELLWSKYEELKAFNPFIHLRYKTHGLIDHTNTHPYPCGHGIYLMHNGIVNVNDSSDRDKSDTWHFIDQLIKPLIDLSPNPHKVIRSDKFRKLIENWMGNNTRMVFGDRGGFIIFNEKAWHKIDNIRTGCEGLLVSNTYAWSGSQFGAPKVTPATYTDNIKAKAHYKNNGQWPRTTHYEYNESAGCYQKVSTPNTPRNVFLPTVKELNHNGIKYYLVTGNVYEDEWGNFYLNTGNAMVFRKDLQDVYNDLSRKHKTVIDVIATSQFVPESSTNNKQTQLPLVCVATETDAQRLGIVTNTLPQANEELALLEIPVLTIPSSSMELTPEDHEKALVREWITRQPWQIATMVYTEPDEAAKVISYLIKNGSARV